MAQVAFERVSKIYPDGTRAVNDINLEIDDGEFMVLVGPSGCGKTTALRMVAGLEEISEGVLKIGERVVNHVPSRDRDIAMVFQSYALYPHLSVYENIAFGLRLKKMSKAEIEQRVERASQLLGLTDYLKRKPRALSGGQRQRVAMGRAIVREPKAFLMDEPLSNLDAKLRVQMRAEIARIQQALKVTTVYVTHDQVEAMTMGHRVAVMRDGELQQVDTPQRLYDAPANLFVASFVGSPPMNLFEAVVERDDSRLVCRIGETELELPADVAAERPALADYSGRPVAVGIRPEDVPWIEEDGVASLPWAPEAEVRILRVPPFAQGIARKAVEEFTIEQGGDLVTNARLDEAIRRLLPTHMQLIMGIGSAEEIALAEVKATEQMKATKVQGHDADPEPVTPEVETKCPVTGAVSKRPRIATDPIVWTEEGWQRLQLVPLIARPLARNTVERFAKNHGIWRVTTHVMDDNKQAMIEADEFDIDTMMVMFTELRAKQIRAEAEGKDALSPEMRAFIEDAKAQGITRCPIRDIEAKIDKCPVDMKTVTPEEAKRAVEKLLQ